LDKTMCLQELLAEVDQGMPDDKPQDTVHSTANLRACIAQQIHHIQHNGFRYILHFIYKYYNWQTLYKWHSSESIFRQIYKQNQSHNTTVLTANPHCSAVHMHAYVHTLQC